MAVAPSTDLRLSENILRFNPKWWWDPVPPWLLEHIKVDLARELTKIQLEKQMRILEVEQIALKETLNAIERIKK